MQRQQGSVLRIISPFDFLLRERSTESTIRLELTPVANRGYYHLLHELENNGVEFVLRKAQQDIRDEVRKGIIYLKGEDITSLYRKEVLCPFMDEELPRERMLGCFVTKVECLRLELVVLELGKLVTFYFSELKLLRIADLHPK